MASPTITLTMRTVTLLALCAPALGYVLPSPVAPRRAVRARVVALEPISTSMAAAFAAGALVPGAALAAKSKEIDEIDETIAKMNSDFTEKLEEKDTELQQKEAELQTA